MGPVCDTDAQCGGPLSKCASTLARSLIGASAPLQTSGLHCVQVACDLTGLPCPAGEACLRKYFPLESNVADICVPTCNPPDFRCPLNYYCLAAAAANPTTEPSVCVPGLLTYRCTSDLDCLAGRCKDTGEGFSLCTIPCTADNECARIASLRESVHCTLKGGDGLTYCARVGAFDGIYCRSQADCAPGDLCNRARPRDPLLCRKPCGSGKGCPDRGGMAQGCVDWFTEPVCVPSAFGLPCSTDRRCIGQLECVTGSILDGAEQIRIQPFCSRRCRVNADCLDDVVIGRQGGWCHGGVCTPRRYAGEKCADPIECESNSCLPSTRDDERGTDIRRCAAVGT